MAIITISRGSYSRGKEVAEKLAERLDYECISRDSLIEYIKELNAHDAKLIRSIEDVPSIFNRFQHGKETYIAYIQSTLLQKLKNDDVVYDGFMGHFFLTDIPNVNVLKVRIISGQADRARIVMERDKISKDQALKFINKIDKQRKKWSQYLYGIDPSDPNQYDVVISVKEIPVETVVDTLSRISRLEQFQLTAESKKALDDLALAAQIRSLLQTYSDVEVSAQEGKVFVKTELSRYREAEFIFEIERLAKQIPTVREINLGIRVSVPLGAETVEKNLIITP
jgi:cytidylate kinase